MTTKFPTREEENKLYEEMKKLAVEFNVPITMAIQRSPVRGPSTVEEVLRQDVILADYVDILKP